MTKPGDGPASIKMAGGTKRLGSVLITSAQAVTWGAYEFLVVNEDAVFATLTTVTGRNLLLGHNDPDGSGGINFAGATITKGMIVQAPATLEGDEPELIRDVSMTSGTVLAYG